MFDVNAMLRAAAAGNLTADGSGAWVDMLGAMTQPVVIAAFAPQAEAGDTLTIKIEEGDNGADVVRSHTMQVIATADVPVWRYMTIKAQSRYLRASWVVTGAPAVAGFGLVLIGPVTGGEYSQF